MTDCQTEIARLTAIVAAQQAKITQLKAKHNETEMYLRLEREAARQNLERAERAEAKIAAALERLAQPIRPYGDKRIPMMPEIEFLRDAYGEELPNDLVRILSDAPTEPVQGDLSIDENFLTVAEGVGLSPKKRQEALEELARIEAKFERQAEPFDTTPLESKPEAFKQTAEDLNAPESDTDEREDTPDLMGNLRKSLEAKIARKAEREALYDGAWRAISGRDEPWGGCAEREKVERVAEFAAGFHRQGQITEAGPARIIQMPASPETSRRYWEVHCRVCTTHQGMASAPNSSMLIGLLEEHNAEHRNTPLPGQMSEPQSIISDSSPNPGTEEER